MMKAKWIVGLLLPAALVLAAPTKTSVATLVEKGKDHDGKEIVATGSVKDFKQKTSRIGNKYFTFKLVDGKAEANVYGRGTLEGGLQPNAKVEVAGKFRMLKKVGNFEVKNEIDVSGNEGEKPKVKVLSGK
jgi:hypothetical protein